jgi:uncharacterized protein (TIGR00252 family)
MRMRRHFLVLLYAVYAWVVVGTAFSAEEAGSASDASMPQPRIEVPAPEAPAASTPAELPATPVAVQPPAPETPASPPLPIEPVAQREPHVALLLPLYSPTYARAAEAAWDGIQAAAEVAGNEDKLPLKGYGTSDHPQDVLTAYQRAVSEGAKLVIGPMTREDVATLIKSGLVSVPTLALNNPENEAGLPKNFYSLGLSLDAEARQVALNAYNPKRRRAVVLFSDEPLQKRVRAAFVDQWKKSGGEIATEAVIGADAKALLALRIALKPVPADVFFLAMDAKVARQVRPYLKPTVPVYATSQVFPGRADANLNLDLRGVRFTDMPWFLQPDQPPATLYPRPKKLLSIDLERFYALGVDAYRIGQLLTQGGAAWQKPLEGVTGRITLPGGFIFARQLTRRQRQGRAVRSRPMIASGAAAEGLAARYLAAQGLSLVQRNYRCRYGEIDMILRDAATLVFVEVRLRSNPNFGGAGASVTAHKRAKLLRAAQHYLARFRELPPCRFDVVALERLDPQKIAWIKDAFQA